MFLILWIWCQCNKRQHPNGSLLWLSVYLGQKLAYKTYEITDAFNVMCLKIYQSILAYLSMLHSVGKWNYISKLQNTPPNRIFTFPVSLQLKVKIDWYIWRPSFYVNHFSNKVLIMMAVIIYVQVCVCLCVQIHSLQTFLFYFCSSTAVTT